MSSLDCRVEAVLEIVLGEVAELVELLADAASCRCRWSARDSRNDLGNPSARHELGIDDEASEQELVGHAFGDRLIDAAAPEVDIDARSRSLDREHTGLLLDVEQLQHLGERHDAQIAAQAGHALAEQADVERA